MASTADVKHRAVKIGGHDLIIQGGPKYRRHTVQLSIVQEYALGVMDNYVMFRLIQRE